MAHSAAAELVRWTLNRESDIAHAKRAARLVQLSDNRRDRAFYLNMLHTAVNTVRISVRMIGFEADQLSLCADHEFSADCTCVAPF